MNDDKPIIVQWIYRPNPDIKPNPELKRLLEESKSYTWTQPAESCDLSLTDEQLRAMSNGQPVKLSEEQSAILKAWLESK